MKPQDIGLNTNFTGWVNSGELQQLQDIAKNAESQKAELLEAQQAIAKAERV